MRCAIVFAVMLVAAPAWADSPDISVRRLLSGWKDQDPSMRLLAKVIASAFANGLSWRGSLAGSQLGFRSFETRIVHSFVTLSHWPRWWPRILLPPRSQEIPALGKTL
jgi:hypothetical protein